MLADLENFGKRGFAARLVTLSGSKGSHCSGQ